MTENYRRVVAESVFVYMKVCAANAAIAHLDFDLIVAAPWIVNLTQFDVTGSRLIFDQRFDYRYLQTSFV